MSKFPLIIFEGIECSGKSTQLKNVVIFLKKNKKKFLYLREPGGTNNSEKLRKLILNKKARELLKNYYKSSNIELNDSRMKMAYLPKRSKLILNFSFKYWKNTNSDNKKNT